MKSKQDATEVPGLCPEEEIIRTEYSSNLVVANHTYCLF